MVNEQTVLDSLLEEIFHLNEEMNEDSFGEPAANSAEHILPSQELQSKRKFEVPEPDIVMLEKIDTSPSPKKRTPVTGDVSI